MVERWSGVKEGVFRLVCFQRDSGKSRVGVEEGVCASFFERKMDADLVRELGLLGGVLGSGDNLRLVVKDREHRYLYVNLGWLESVGLEVDAEVLGKTVFDIFPVWRANRYHQEEVRVMEGGETIDTCEELKIVEGGRQQLWRSLKAPRYDEEKKICGMVIVGMLIDPEMLRARLPDNRPSAVEWMEQHACEPNTIENLGREMNCSRRSLERFFQENTGMSPARYRLQCRMVRAKELLKMSRKSVAQIASECGFADQSHLTKAFKVEVGFTPGAWRKRERE